MNGNYASSSCSIYNSSTCLGFVISLSVLKEVLIAVVIEPGQSMYHLILATHEMLTNPSGFLLSVDDT